MLLKPVTRIAAACALLFSQTATSASLQEVLRQSLQNDPELLEAKANQEAAHTDINIAKSAHLPTLSLTAAQVLAQNHRYESNARAKGINPGLQGKLNLFSFGGIDARVRYNEHKYDYYHYKYFETQETLGQTISRLYLSALRAKESLLAAQNNLQRHDQIINDLKIITQYDKGRQSELDQAMARRLRVQAYLAEQTRVMELNLSRLGKYTQQRLNPAALRDPFVGENAISIIRRYKSRDLANQPSYQAQQAERESVLAELDVNKASRYPSIDLIASATRDNREIYVNFGWDFYNPTANYQVERSSHTLVAAEAKSEQILRDVSERTRSAEVDMKQSLNRLHIAEQQIAAQKKVIKAYELQFKIARRTLLDVLDSYSDLWNIELEAVSSRNDFRDAALEYLSSQAAIAQWAGVKQDRNAPTRAEPKTFKDHLPDNFLPQNFQERLAAFEWFKGKDDAQSADSASNQNTESADTTNANPFTALDQDPAAETVYTPSAKAKKTLSGSLKNSKNTKTKSVPEPVSNIDNAANIQSVNPDDMPAIDDAQFNQEPVLSYTDIMGDTEKQKAAEQTAVPKSARKAAKAKKASQTISPAATPEEQMARALMKANNAPIATEPANHETASPTVDATSLDVLPQQPEPALESSPMTQPNALPDAQSMKKASQKPKQTTHTKINTRKLMAEVAANQAAESSALAAPQAQTQPISSTNETPKMETPKVQLIDAPEHGVVWKDNATASSAKAKSVKASTPSTTPKTDNSASKTTSKTTTKTSSDAKKSANEALKKGKSAVKSGQSTLKPALETESSSKSSTSKKVKTVSSANDVLPSSLVWEARVPYGEV